jgi:hypothetical protein
MNLKRAIPFESILKIPARGSGQIEAGKVVPVEDVIKRQRKRRETQYG